MVSLIKSTDKQNRNLEDINTSDYYISKYPDTYIKLANSRCIFLAEDLTKDNAATITAFLLRYNKESKKSPILFYINSDGGDGAAFMNVYDVINAISAPVKTICMSKAFSAGAFILASGQKNSRYVYKHSKIMIHGLQCAFPAISDDQKDSETYYSFLDSYNDRAMKILAKHTGQTLKKIKEDCKSDLYLDAKQAVEYGLADYILT